MSPLTIVQEDWGSNPTHIKVTVMRKYGQNYGKKEQYMNGT